LTTQVVADYMTVRMSGRAWVYVSAPDILTCAPF